MRVIDGAGLRKKSMRTYKSAVSAHLADVRLGRRRHIVQVRVVQILICLCALAGIGLGADYGKVTMSQVATGVYLFTTSPYGDVGFGGNSVAILTDEGVVMFDTSGTPASGQAILSEVRKLTNKPMLYVINSHWHWDHWGGNQVFKAAFPHAQFLSHDKNRDLMMNVSLKTGNENVI